MSIELIAMLGGSIAGFVMKLIAAQSQAQSHQLEMMLKKQELADASIDKAHARGGIWVRRLITVVILFAVVIAPFVVSYTGQGVSVLSEGNRGIIGILGSIIGFGGNNWETVEGFVLLPEVRQGLLAILGFYFGSSQIK